MKTKDLTKMPIMDVLSKIQQERIESNAKANKDEDYIYETRLGFVLQDLTSALCLYENGQNNLLESLKVNALQQIANELHEMNSKE